MNKIIEPGVPYKRFDKPVKVDVVIDGRNLTAVVSGEYDLPINFAYQVDFSDGFEAMFADYEGGWWAEHRRGGKPYAEAIKPTLDKLRGESRR